MTDTLTDRPTDRRDRRRTERRAQREENLSYKVEGLYIKEEGTNFKIKLKIVFGKYRIGKKFNKNKHLYI